MLAFVCIRHMWKSILVSKRTDSILECDMRFKIYQYQYILFGVDKTIPSISNSHSILLHQLIERHKLSIFCSFAHVEKFDVVFFLLLKMTYSRDNSRRSFLRNCLKQKIVLFRMQLHTIRNKQEFLQIKW